MTKRYKILQKKLKELESDLSLPITESSIESIPNQFTFLKAYLSAEIASNPIRPRHLSHIEKNLARLQTEFDKRVSGFDPFRTGFEPVETELDPVETGSGCSCTKSCLNDDGESEFDQAFYDLEPKEEEYFEADLGRVEPGQVVEAIEKGDGWAWGIYGPVLAGGVLIGAVSMGFLGELYNGCSNLGYVNYRGTLIPT